MGRGRGRGAEKKVEPQLLPPGGVLKHIFGASVGRTNTKCFYNLKKSEKKRSRG